MLHPTLYYWSLSATKPFQPQNPLVLRTMSVTLTADVLEDEIAVSVARALTAADQRAREFGVDAQNSLITITQTDNGLCWRVNYGARDYIERRGGDLIIDVDANDAHIRQVLQGQ